MGLIKAGIGALGGTLADQWKEFFYCDAIDANVLVTKGKKRISGRSSNTKGNDNIISNGSGIAVADGQCMIIVEQGKVVEVCAEPGEFTYNSSTEPSIFAGSLGTSILDTFKTIGKRFTYGGDTGKDQRVYYFNIKEIIGNKFGTPNPVPYKDWGHPLMNARTNSYIAMSVKVKCFGTYTFQITDPFMFMSKIAGLAEVYRKDELVDQMRAEVIGAFSNVMNGLGSDKYKIEVLELPNKTDEIKDIMDQEVFDQPIRDRGIKLVSFIVESLTLDEESEDKIDKYEIGGDAYQQQGNLVSAYSEGVVGAANNPNGAMNGFMGVGMMNMAGGGMFGGAATGAFNNAPPMQPNPQALNNNPVEPSVETLEQKTVNATPVSTPNSKACSKCGMPVSGKFCGNCGTPVATKKFCTNCGTEVTGNFCTNCGTKA